MAQDLGTSHETLRHWIRIDDSHSATGSSAGSAEDENAALRKRIREVEEKRDLLRTAAKSFAGETRW